jgi:hypothetical protein
MSLVLDQLSEFGWLFLFVLVCYAGAKGVKL